MPLTRMMSLKQLLTIHAVITLAAAVVLILAPAAIPKTVDIELASNGYLLSYFLGAAELSVAYLSFYSRNITDKAALRIIITTFIVFHAATGILEIYALLQGASLKIIGNVILRVAVIVLFYCYGIRKKK